MMKAHCKIHLDQNSLHDFWEESAHLLVNIARFVLGISPMAPLMGTGLIGFTLRKRAEHRIPILGLSSDIILPGLK